MTEKLESQRAGGRVSSLQTDWSAVVGQIRAGDATGEETLYGSLVNGARLFLRRRLGTADVEDRVHDLFLIVVQAIRQGELREPTRLMGFVRTVLHRQLGQEFSRLIRARETSADLDLAVDLSSATPSPEQQTAIQENLDLMKQMLREMGGRDFEILTRCYLREQPSGQIRSEMHLTETQFNLLKSRAKTRLRELVRQRLDRKPLNRQ